MHYIFGFLRTFLRRYATWREPRVDAFSTADFNISTNCPPRLFIDVSN